MQDGYVYVRPAIPFRRRHGSFEAESSRAIRADAAAPAWAVAVRPCLPENDEGACDRSAVRAEDATIQDVPCTDLRATRCGEAALLERTGAITRVGWQALDSPDAVRASAPPAATAVRRHASIRSIALQDRRRPLDADRAADCGSWLLPLAVIREPGVTDGEVNLARSGEFPRPTR